VEKNLCVSTHNPSVLVHFLIVILMKHIFIVGNIFLPCAVTWARTSFHHTSRTMCRQNITFLPALKKKKHYHVILCKLKRTFKLLYKKYFRLFGHCVTHADQIRKSSEIFNFISDFFNVPNMSEFINTVINTMWPYDQGQFVWTLRHSM